MTERLRFAAPKHAPAGLWRRVPPMVFAPILSLLALALAWRWAAETFHLPLALPGFLDGLAVAPFLFAALAYLVKVARRPGVIIDECAALPGRVGLGAAALSLYLCAGVLAPHALWLGRAVLVLGLAAQIGLIWPGLRQIGATAEGINAIGPDWQFAPSGLLVAAAVAPMLGWAGLGRVLIYPGALLALAIAAISLWQLRRHRVPAVLLPLLALHLMPAAAYGIAALQLGGPLLVPAYGLVLAGLLLLPFLAIRAGTGLFLSVITIPLALSAAFFVRLALAFPGWWWFALLAAFLLVVATFLCIPMAFLILRDWARGRLAVRSNAAIA